MLFIKDFFNLPEWVMYIEIIVYSYILFIIILVASRKFNKKHNLEQAAETVQETETVEIEKDNQDSTMDSRSLPELTVVELRQIAKGLKVKNWWTIRKAELVTCIMQKYFDEAWRKL